MLTELGTVLPAATKRNQHRAKPHEQSPGKTRHKLPESSPSEVIQDGLNSPSNELCDVREMLSPWRLIIASARGLFTGAARPGPPLPAPVDATDSRRESRGVRKQCGHREPLLAWGAVRTLPGSRCPGAGQRPTSQAGLAKGSS